MIEKIIQWSAHNRIFVFVITALAIIAGWHALTRSPVDAIPDLSDPQVIIYAQWDKPPQILEDQVAYPIISALLGAPKIKDIRGFSDYGFSYIYLIFEEGTDLYWARSRVLEYLSKVSSRLPSGVKVELGPDATGVGWVYEYALVDESGKLSQADLKGFQDWHLKFALQSVPGVSEVATLGGMTKQYQVVVNPQILLAYGLSLSDVTKAIQSSNQETGARLLEFAGREYMVTVKGYLKNKEDLESVVLKSVNGVPVKVKDVATVTLGPDLRRGVAELNGRGETTGGIIVMRSGENAMDVIKRVKEKIQSITLPPGVKFVPVYDRSELIQRSIETLEKKLVEEILVVALVVIIFLMHLPSAAIPILTLPIATLLSFIPVLLMGMSSNIMSLGGIAIAIGAMVDASIVMVENVHKRIAEWQHQGKTRPFSNVILSAVTEVGRSSFFSLLVIAVAFLPIFTLEGVEGRLFRPLAFTKNFAMLLGALLSITLVPALVMVFIRQKAASFKPLWASKLFNRVLVGEIHSEDTHPVSRFLHKLYTPAVKLVLKYPKRTLGIALGLFLLSMPFFFSLGKEFMPPLNEGSALYMPTTYPGISVGQASELLKLQDRIIKSFSEVESVFGKAGRAESSTDPAPFSMMETTIVFKPQDHWGFKERWYSKVIPEFLKLPFQLFLPERKSYEELIQEMNDALQIPGQVNAWTLPIKGRLDMLTTGVRTPVGIKIYAGDLKLIEGLGKEIETVAKTVRGTRSVYAERTTGGFFINYYLKREAMARLGLNVQDVQMILSAAVGGEIISQTVEGRERYPIQVRYPREFRDDLDKLARIYIPTPTGAQVPIGQIAELSIETGPGMIRDENGRLAGYVFIDVADRDIGSYVEELKSAISGKVKFPEGAYPVFSGQYESMIRVAQKMALVIPLTLLIILFLIYMNTRSMVKTLIILLAVPFSLIGVTWILFILGYNVSIGVWAGIIALLGVDAETGIFMLMYLDLSYKEAKEHGRLRNLEELKQTIIEGAVKRIRPKLMTVLAAFIGLLPIMWSASHEAGADMMKRIAAPMVGGILSSFLMELLVYPAIYLVWKKRELLKKPNPVPSP